MSGNAKERDIRRLAEKAEFDSYRTREEWMFRDAFIPVLQKIADDLKRKIVLQENVLMAYRGILHHADVYIPSARLVIEIDGGVHNKLSKMKVDEFNERRIYEGLGVNVYRMTNEQVADPRSLSVVLKDIERLVRDEMHQSPLAARLVAVKLSQHRKKAVVAKGATPRSASFKKRRRSKRKRQYSRHQRWGGTVTLIVPDRRKS